ncbi:MAG: 5'(3')-deoxyribonucleotidase [Sphingobacteriales bacterium]|nr:MAG: 5'(3')-deoxyribonucleotidase [Sphingobacteriales bacterium]
MSKKRLLVDMDGVMADVYQQFFKMDEEEYGVRKTLEQVLGKWEREAFKNERAYVTRKGFFREAPVMEGSIEAVKLLNDKFELFVVSAAMEFPNSLPEKLEWLAEHFPFLTWHQLVFCGLKTIVKGDIMIDDHYRNLDHFTGRTILFTQPHNYGHDDKHHERVHSWKEVLEKLL